MTWLYLAILSGLLLGVYDLLKKQSVTGNAVLPVLLIANAAAALVWIPFVLMSFFSPEWVPHVELRVEVIGIRDHLLLFLKSALVGTSWLFAYFAVKHLPISIAGSVRSVSPVFTIVGALLLFQESPSGAQWLGIVITLIFFFLLSMVGKLEGIHFENNGWIWLCLFGTLLSACSGLYDKYLLGYRGFTPATVQAWFSIYLFVFMVIPGIGWYRGWWKHGAFVWKRTIPLVGVSLLVADFFYFKSLSDPDAMVSVVSCLRRGAVLVSFFAGTILFQEKQFLKKLPCVLGILAGIVIILIS